MLNDRAHILEHNDPCMARIIMKKSQQSIVGPIRFTLWFLLLFLESHNKKLTARNSHNNYKHSFQNIIITVI